MQIIQLPGCPIRESCSTSLNAFRWRNHSVPLITGTTKIKLFSNHFMTLCYDTAENFNHTLTKSLFILKNDNLSTVIGNKYQNKFINAWIHK